MGRQFFMDINLFGVIIASVILIISMSVSYSITRDQVETSCDKCPIFVESENWVNFDNRVRRAINESVKRVVVAATSPSEEIISSFYLDSLKTAKASGAYISFLIPENSSSTKKLLNEKGFENVTFANVAVSFIVTDDTALMYCPLFENRTGISKKHSYLAISSCKTAIDDIVNYFNFQWLAATGKDSRIKKLSDMAKTSVTIPLYINKTQESMYFFHNSPFGGEAGRIGTSYIIPEIIYNTPVDIYLFLDSIPSLNNDQIGKSVSFFTVFKRILIAKKHRINYLVPNISIDNSRRWLNATAAFSSAQIRLYDAEDIGPNYMLIGNRTFIFSHSLKGKVVDEQIGFHFSTNSVDFATKLKSKYKEVWKSSTPYTYN